MNIKIKTIPNNSQKYNTCGNYGVDKRGNVWIEVSRMKRPYQWLIAIHELVEIFLCEIENVTVKAIDAFDLAFEWDRRKGLHTDEEEPGDANAPYRDQHCMATAVERMLCGYLGISWNEYEEACVKLTKSYKPKK